MYIEYLYSIKMVSLRLLTFTLIFIILIQDVFCQSADDVKSLLTQLFTTGSYNKLVRPSDNQSVAMEIYTNLFLISITDIDEVKEKMTTTAYLELSWDDTYLSWTPADYNGVSYIYIPQSDIWKPDIALDNGYSKMKELGDNSLLTKITSDGEVSWYPYDVFETTCRIDITYFPFDKQTCKIQLGVWTSTIKDVVVKLGDSGVNLDDYNENGEWKLLTTSGKTTVNSDNETLVTFALHVKRKPEYYLYNMVLPVLFLSFLASFTFVIPVDSGEKMGFCMTMYLTFAVFLTIVSAQLPATSTHSLLSKYLVFLVIISTLITLVTAIELRINNRSTDCFKIPTWLQMLVKTSRVIQHGQLCRRSRQKNTAITPKSTQENLTIVSVESQPQEENISGNVEETDALEDNIVWADAVSALDFYFFWVFLIANFLGTIILLANGYIQSEQ